MSLFYYLEELLLPRRNPALGQGLKNYLNKKFRIDFREIFGKPIIQQVNECEKEKLFELRTIQGQQCLMKGRTDSREIERKHWFFRETST